MPPRPSAVSDDYAGRTPCIKHTRVYAGVSRGSMRHDTWSSCEHTSGNFTCRYSHTVFNLKRVIALGRRGLTEGLRVVSLEYGHGFERYGAYESPDSGWDVKVDGRNQVAGRRRDLPKSLLLAELAVGITSKGAPDVQYEKKQSMCTDQQKPAGCPRGAGCRYDHDILDSRRLEALAWKRRGPAPVFETRDYLALECHLNAQSDSSVTWKILLKPDAFRGVKVGDPLRANFSSGQLLVAGGDLFELIHHLEKVLADEGNSEAW
ncbi:hypothetical protein CC2G_003444 [Coprinopsis cinerea AmutBmut pab1-1]|nr:hypothetical protein CC2G_003444 [Coprinopsis cinerea AmutBmut pab1-1]